MHAGSFASNNFFMHVCLHVGNLICIHVQVDSNRVAVRVLVSLLWGVCSLMWAPGTGRERIEKEENTSQTYGTHYHLSICHARHAQNDTVILSILMSCGPKSPDSLGDGELDCVERPTVNGSARIDLRKTQIYRKENDLVNLLGSTPIRPRIPILTFVSPACLLA